MELFGCFRYLKKGLFGKQGKTALLFLSIRMALLSPCPTPVSDPRLQTEFSPFTTPFPKLPLEMPLGYVSELSLNSKIQAVKDER